MTFCCNWANAIVRQATGRSLIVLGLALLFGGCGRRTPSEKALGPDVIADVAGVPITAHTFRQEMRLRSGNGVSFATATNREALLNELIDDEALYAKAKTSGFDQKPEVREAIKRMIIARFRDEEMQQHGGDSPVTEQEIQHYYDLHREQYATPAEVHAAMIFMRIPPEATPEKRAQVLARAQAALKEAKAAATPDDFARVVQAHSEDQGTRYRGGDLGWFSQAAPPWGMERAAVKALFALQQPGEFAPLVPTQKGVYILKLLGLKPAGIRPLNQVREGIRYSLQRKIKAQRKQQFYAQIRAGLKIRVNDALLKMIRPPIGPNERAPPSLPATVAETKQP